MTWAMRLNGGQLMDDGAGVHFPGIGGNGWTVNVIADGTTFGTLEPLAKTMNTLMTSGSWETLGAPGNRSPALILEVEGDTPDGLNAGEVWLSALMGSGALEWLPPGQSVWTVFDVIWSYVDRTMDSRWDLDDAAWIRYYRIPLRALPYARSPELTITDAAPSAGTAIVDTQVTNASATTGFSASWSRSTYNPGSGSITPANAVAGWVRASYSNGVQDRGTLLKLKYAFSTPVLAATPYVRVDFRIYAGTFSPPALYSTSTGSSGFVEPARSSIVDLGGGVFGGTVYYPVPDGTSTIEIRGGMLSNTANTYIEIDQIRKLSRLPDLGTNRQKFAAITPGGSAPADGSLHVTAAAALGRVLVHTYPLGRPSPALMQYRTVGGAQVPDTSCVNGERVTVYPSPLTLTIPDPQLPTRGRATLWVKMRVDTAPITLRWTLTPTSNGSTVGQSQTRDTVVPVGTMVMMPVGLIHLSSVTGASGSHTLTFLRAFGSGDLYIDEVWALGKDDSSATTVVDAGTGTLASGGPSNHFWLNAPSPTKRAGEVLIGTNLNDARWPSTFQSGPQIHKFPAGGVSVLVVTTNATDASTDFTHFKRWTHHAAEAS